MLQQNQNIVNTRFHGLFILLIIVGGITFGYNISIIASALPHIKLDFAPSEKILSLIAGLVFLGTMIAKLMIAPLTDYLGRRYTLIIGSIIFIIGSILIIYGDNLDYILWGRTIQGFGGGLLMFTTSLYIVEVSNDKNRGKFTALYQLCFTLGLLGANILGLAIFNINWHLNFVFLIGLSLIFLLLIIILPCSPRWLFRKGFHDKALFSLNIDHNCYESVNILNNWKKTNTLNSSANILKPKYLKALFLVVVVTCLNQLTGINAILQTSTMLIAQAGLKTHAALIGSIGITAVNLFVTIIGINLVDRFPRNKLLGYSALSITLAHLIVASNFFLNIHDSGLFLFGLFLFIASYAIGPGIIIWLVFSEYLPLPVRSQGISIAGFINALAGFLISSMFLNIAKHFGISWVFLSCAGFSFLYAIIPLFYLPNTNKKDIEDFDNLFTKTKTSK